MIQMRNLQRQYETMKVEMDASIADVVASGTYIMGRTVEELERRLAAYVGIKHCITCSSGTDALCMALAALGVSSGDAVFVPDFTFFATAEAVVRQGATPVFVDVELSTYNMSVNDLEKKIGAVMSEGRLKPAAVIAVDLFGNLADYESITSLCQQYGLSLVEDGAQSFGSSRGGQRACSFGHIAATSFFPSKPLGCYGDGGALFTNDDQIDSLLRSLRIHGRGRDKYDNVRVGFNSRLDAIQSAVLGVKLNHLDDELSKIGRLAQYYTKSLRGLLCIETPEVDCASAWAQYTVRIRGGQRDAVRNELVLRDVAAAVYYPRTMSQQQAFKSLNQPLCTNAKELCGEVLSLPVCPYISDEEAEQVVNAFVGAVKAVGL